MFKDRILKSLLEAFIGCSSKVPTMRTRQLPWTMAKPQGQRRKSRRKEADGFCKRMQTQFEKKNKTNAMAICSVLCPFVWRRILYCDINDIG